MFLVPNCCVSVLYTALGKRFWNHLPTQLFKLFKAWWVESDEVKRPSNKGVLTRVKQGTPAEFMQLKTTGLHPCCSNK